MAKDYPAPPVKGIEVYRRDVVVKHHGQAPKWIAAPTRSEVSRLTQESLKRLSFVANNTDVELDTMITLTYPNDFTKDGKESKKHLNAFFSWMRRRIDPFSYLWFLEFQNRGAPHYHVLYCSHGIRIPKAELSDVWYRLVGSGDEKHLLAGTRIEKIRSQNGAGRYAAKYGAKTQQKAVPDEFRSVGRFWGHSRDVAPKPIYKMDVRNEETLSIIIDGWHRSRAAIEHGYSTLYGAADDVKRNLGL